MPQLIGVEHRSHRLYEAIDDIERDDAHGMPGGIEYQRSRLTVDLDVAQAGKGRASRSQEQTRDFLASEYGVGGCGGLATTIAVADDVGGEQTNQSLLVAGQDRIEEPPGEFLTLLT